MVYLSNPLFLLAIGGGVLTLGDIIFRYWVDQSSPVLYAMGLATYLLGLIFLVESFKYQNIAVASATFVIFNILSLLVVSWAYFGDKISLTQTIGIFLAIVAIFLLEVGNV